MHIVATVALLQVFFTATAAVSGTGSTETLMTADLGHIAVLPCYTLGNETPYLTTWTKNGREVISGDGFSSSTPPGKQRLALLHDGSLNIVGVLSQDEGSYLCSSSLPGNRTFQARVQLQVTSGPDQVSASITATSVLPNGTVVAHQGSSVSLECSAFSFPSQRLSWAFRGASYSNDTLVSTSENRLTFRMQNVQPSTQGVYTCTAFNTVSNKSVSNSTQLLVYYVPGTHPDCSWEPVEDPSHVRFICSWYGAYPPPMLRWGKDGTFQMTDRLAATMNRSLLSNEQTLTCTAQHPLLGSGEERACSFTLKSPCPEGEPLATALEASSITLTCSETISIPPANTTWRKGLQRDSIVTGSKYVLSEDGPVLKLTILNISKDDEGYFFCHSENPLGVRELDVFLTVKTASSAYTGAIIGVFIAALIVGSAVIVAKILYASRHKICLGGGIGRMEEDRGDVLSLVDSDDEQIFQDTVPQLPQLPPITNGHHTTLVEIHRIPSSDHEDTEVTHTSQQQQEDTEQKEQPEDLVTF